MVAPRLCKRPVIAAAALLFAAAPLGAFAHGNGGGHGRGHGGQHAVGAAHVSPTGRAVGGASPHVVMPGHVHGGAIHGGGVSPGFRHGHWVHGVRGGQLGWFWVGAAAPFYVQPLAPAAVLVQPEALYYCNVLQAYYPEVLNCPEPWLLVDPSSGSIQQ